MWCGKRADPTGICPQLRGCAGLVLVRAQPCSRVVQAASSMCHSVCAAFSESIGRDWVLSLLWWLFPKVDLPLWHRIEGTCVLMIPLSLCLFMLPFETDVRLKCLLVQKLGVDSIQGTIFAGMKRCAVLVMIMTWLLIVFFDIGDRNRREELRIFLLIPFRKWMWLGQWRSDPFSHHCPRSLACAGKMGTGTTSSFFFLLLTKWRSEWMVPFSKVWIQKSQSCYQK